MQLTIERDAVVDTVAHVARRAKQNTIPILSHILLTAAKDKLTLTGNDAMSCSSGSVAAEVTKPCQCAIPGANFLGIIEKMPKGSNIALKYDDGAHAHLEVSHGRSRYRLPTLPIADFPPIMEPTDPVSIGLTAEQIATIFDGPRIVIGDDAQGSYAGLYFHTDAAGNLSGCATNGTRLIKSATDTKAPAEAPSIIIPKRAIEEILKTAGGNGAEFSWSDKILQVRAGEWTYATKLIDAQFPDYEKFLPKPNGHCFTTETASFRNTISRLMVLETNKSSVLLEWDEDGISASMSGDGEGAEHIECFAMTAPAGHVSVAAASLMDAASALDGKSLTFHISSERQPFLVLSDDNPGSTVMLAPMNVRKP